MSASRIFLAGDYRSQVLIDKVERHSSAMDNLAFGQLSDTIHHRTNRVADVNLLDNRKGLFEATNADGLTERFSVFQSGETASLLKSTSIAATPRRNLFLFRNIW